MGGGGGGGGGGLPQIYDLSLEDISRTLLHV